MSFSAFLSTVLAAILMSSSGGAADAAQAGAAAPEGRAILCPDNLDRAELEPLGPGPARLAAVRCLDRGTDYRPPVVSPDGQAVAFWEDGARGHALSIVPLDGRPGATLPNRVTFRNFGSIAALESRQDSLAWRADGRGIWTVEQQLSAPGGWPRGGLTPIRVDASGTVTRLTPPRHPAGPLDGLAWVGQGGRAIVQFGTRGDYYRPEHRDRAPTFAMVDVPGGRILDTLTAADAEPLRRRAGAHNGFGLFDIAAVRMPGGRLRVLVQFERMVDPAQPPRAERGDTPNHFLPAAWVVWTQGQPPVALTSPFGDRFSRAELTPDGSRILAWRPLQPEGVQIFDCRNCPPPPPPTPVERPIAQLVDARTGRVIWSLPARATAFWNAYGSPAVSPDGRHALLSLPAAGGRQILALVAMANGRVLQRFSTACEGCYPQRFGFTRGGRQMWVSVVNHIAFYDLH